MMPATCGHPACLPDGRGCPWCANDDLRLKNEDLQSKLTALESRVARFEEHREAVRGTPEGVIGALWEYAFDCGLPLSSSEAPLSFVVKTHQQERQKLQNQVATLTQALRGAVGTHGEPCPDFPCEALERWRQLLNEIGDAANALEREIIERIAKRVANILEGSIVHRVIVQKNGIYIHADDVLLEIRRMP